MTAASNIPWSIKGIDPRTREVAKDLARRSGLTLGEYLNTLITSGGELSPGADPSRGAPEGAPAEVAEALAQLGARIEAAEERSSAAITGVDRSVQGVLSRLAAAEQGQAAALERLETVERADRLVVAEGGAGPVEAVKSLESSIGKLAAQVYAGDEHNGLALSKIVERLERAEAQTTAAVVRLESSFAGLDQRLRATEQRPAGAGGGVSESRFEQLAAELHARVDAARADMAQTLERAAEGRFDQVERVVETLSANVEAAERRSHQAIEKLGHEVLRIAETLGKRMVQVENRSADAIEQVGGEVARIAGVMESRAKVSDNAHGQALERLGHEIARISERLAERIAASERRSAQAIDDVGDQVLRATDKLNTRYDRAADDLADRIRASEERTARFLDEARDRLDARIGDTARRTPAPAAYRAYDALARLDGPEVAPEPDSPFATGAGGPTRARLLRRPQTAGAAGSPFAAEQPQPEPAPSPEPATIELAAPGASPEPAVVEHPAPEPEPAFPAAVAPEPEPEPLVLAPAPMEVAEPVADEPVVEPVAASAFQLSPEAQRMLDGDGPLDLGPPVEPTPEPQLAAEPTPESETIVRAQWDGDVVHDHSGATVADSGPEEAFEPDDEFTTFAPAAAEPEPTREPAYESLDEFDDLVAFEGEASGPSPHEPEPEPVAAVYYGEPALPVMTDPGPPLSTRDVLERARAAARAGGAVRASPLAARAQAAAGRIPAASAGDKLRGLRLPSLPSLRRDSTLRTALIASATAAALSVFFASWAIFNDDDSTASAAAQVAETPRPTAPGTPKLAALRVEAGGARTVPAEGAAELYAQAVAQLKTGDAAAVPTLRQAADLGDPQAQLHLASLYEAGSKGLPKNPAEARRWTERAAESGDRRAMHNLGLLHFEGVGAPKDLAQARQWFRRAADLGQSDSQYNLGLIHERGFGIARNPAEAYKWYLIAARSGDGEARTAAERLERVLSGPAKVAAERAALSFRADSGLRPTTAVAAVATPDVAAAQRALFRLGYYKGPADGRASPALRQALVAWQQASGAEPDGVIDADAVAALSRAG